MTTSEFVENFAGLNPTKGVKKLRAESTSFSVKFDAILSRLFLTRPAVESSVNSSVDWRNTGAVGGVRQQVRNKVEKVVNFFLKLPETFQGQMWVLLVVFRGGRH